MALMVKEIQVQMMRDSNQHVTDGEAVQKLSEEFQDIVEIIQTNERNAGMKAMMDMLGIKP